MGLVIVIILLAYFWAEQLPASQSLKRGNDMYWEMSRKFAEQYRQEAQKTDRFYNSSTGNINRYFYSDGSLYCDATTGKYYGKGKYYCRADGVMADYSKASHGFQRPPKN